MGTTNTLDLNNRVSRLEKGSSGTTDAAKRSDIASEFSAETAYTTGTYVYHEGKLYIFNTDHAAGAWDASDVAEANVTDEVTSNKAAIDALDDEVDAIAAVAGQKAYGTPVSILNATEQAPYTCPSDGIVVINPVSVSDNHYLSLFTTAFSGLVLGRVNGHAGASNTVMTIPVLKGTELYIQKEVGTSTAIADFIPYVAAT